MLDHGESAGNLCCPAGTPVTRTFLVGLEKQLIIFANIAPQTLATSTLNIAATSTSGLAVSFATQTPAICSLGGTNVTLLAAGICTIAATQGGNSIYAAAPVDTNSFRISKVTQTITFTSPPTTTLATSSINLVGSATSSFPVSFTASPATICTVSGTVLSLVAAGRCSVTAAQVGDAKWNPAANVTRVFTVAKIAQTISFNALSTTPLAAGTVALSASTSSGLTVTFTSRTPTVCTVIGNRVTLIKTGACTIAANQAGDATYLAAPQSVRSFTVSSAGLIAQTISGFVPPASVAYAPGLIITLSATGGASSNPVTFGSNSTSVCTVSGATVTVLSYGSCVVTADQAGSTGYSAAAQVNVTINVTAAAQTITFGPIPSKVSSDLPFPVSATASSGLGVVVTSNTLSACTVQNSTVTLIRDGQCTLAADQIGNDNYQPAATVLQSFSVAPGAAAQRIVSVAVGYAHACALTDAGGIKCWGFNGYGALGDGTTTDRAAPVDVIGLGGTATAVAAGWYRTCALLSNGDIKCWGSNGTGALGDGTTTDSASPVQVVTGGLAATKIVVGGIHSCAIFVNGEARCWGSNLFGQLGDATGSNSALPVTVVELGGAVTAIQAGFYNSCAQAAGTWKCWGFNIRSYQPLGASQFEVLYLPESRPQWGFNPTAVALGQIHSCGLTSGNGAKCWGYAAYGQLGDGVSTPVQPIPVDVSGLMSGTSAISAAAYSTCALTSAGAVKCWGANFGPTPTDVIGATSGMVAVGVGSGFSCGVTYRGGVRCWGVANQFGQIGRSFSGIRADADYVTGLYDGVAFNQSILFPNPGPRVFGDAPFAISATASSGLSVSFRSATPSVCTVANGVVTLLDGGVCTIVASQSGGPTTVAAPEVSQSFLVTNNPQPQAITNFAPPSSIDSSQKYLILSATGGASGNPVVFATSTPNVCRVGAGFVTILDAGNCIVTAYQLGNAFFSAAVPITATIVVVAPATLVPQTLTKLTPGSPLTFYGSTQVQLNIQSDGSVNPIAAASTTPAICTVSNNLYLNVLALGTCQITATQAGNGIYAPGQVIFAIDVVLYVPPPPSIVGAALGVGAGHACAVSATGSLRCWGSNASGQLGDATTSNRSTPVDVVGITTGVVAVAGGGFHTCLLTSAGGVRCWGANDRGQLGNGNNTPSLSPVNVQGLSTGVLDIALGNAHSCAFMQGGSIKCWGAGTNGAVGDGAGLDRNAPVDVPLAGSGNVDLRAGGQHTCVVTAGGTVKCWGDNSAGQLGDGTTAAVQLSPVTATGLSGAALGVEVGGLHTCALLADGSVQCWGANTSGQLGTGDNTAQPLPTGVVGLSAGTTSIALGTATSCAIVNAGGVKCWGNINNATLASDVDGLDTLTAELGVGGAFACALNANGLVRCWGDNTFGQLGDGTNSAKPIAVPVIGFVAGGVPTKSLQTISFTANASTSLSQSTVNLAVAASSGLPVVISSLDTSVCTVSGIIATLVKVGNCQLVANQGGNISFFAAPQVSQSFQVTLGTSGLTGQIISSFILPSTITVGGTAFLTASGGASGNPVIFSSLSPSTCSVSGNVLTALAASSTCTVAASQAGNATYSAAQTVAATTTISKQSQSITFTQPSNHALSESNFTLVPTASSNLSVSLSSVTVGVCTVSNSSVTLLAAGNCTLVASQVGNGIFDPAPSEQRTFVISALLPQKITGFNPTSPVQYVLNGTFTLLATGGASGNPVTFSASAPSICDIVGSTVRLLGAGDCNLYADQTGNGVYAPATQVFAKVQIGKGAQTITFATIPDQVFGGPLLNVSPTASSGLSVAISSLTPSVCVTSGAATFAIIMNGTGLCTIAANQSGSLHFDAAPQVIVTFNVAKAPQVITHFLPASPIDFVAGMTLNLSASVPGNSTLIQYNTQTPDVCTVQNGLVTVHQAGTCLLTAWHPGDLIYLPAPQVQATIVIRRNIQAINFTPLLSASYDLQSINVLAAATSGLLVNLSSTTNSICTVSGTTVALVTIGTCTIVASQLGDGNYLPAQEISQSFSITKAAQVITGFSTMPAYAIYLAGGSITLTALGGASGNAVVFGTNSPLVCTIEGIYARIVSPGECIITANQAGSTVYQSAVEFVRTVTIAKQNTFMTLTFGRYSNVIFQDGLTVPVVIDRTFGLNVSVTSNTPDICTYLPNSTQNSVAVLSAGTCQVTANLAETVNYLGATSTATLAILKAPQSVNNFAPPTPLAFVANSTFSLVSTLSSGLVPQYTTVTPLTCSVAGNVVTMIAVGTCRLTSSHPGTTNYVEASTVVATVVFETPTEAVTPPRIVTPALLKAAVGMPYADIIIISASYPVTNALITGLPPGMAAQHNGIGSIQLSGSPTIAGSFPLSIVVTSNNGIVTLSTQLQVDIALKDITKLAAGFYHTCAIKDGGVVCWGNNNFGQLGNGTYTSSATPVMAMPTGSGATALSAKAYSTCAVVSGGVKCWGQSIASSVPVSVIGANGNATDVSVGAGHACAVISQGVQCWGDNVFGQLGNGTSGYLTSSSTPVVAIPANSGVTAIAAGTAHSCAVGNGGVRCWGTGSNSELGQSYVTTSSVPITAIAEGSGVTGIAASVISISDASTVCAIVNGGVRCWGYNESGFAFNGTPVLFKTRIADQSGVTAIDTGTLHACAISSGGMRCWGRNGYGQLGLGYSDASVNFNRPPDETLAAGSGATLVAAGNGYTCASVSSFVRCWGQNESFELGNSTPPRNSAPTAAIATGGGVTSVSAGANHSCAVIAGGVKCWGANSLGQLGDNTSVAKSAPVTSIPAGNGVTAVSSGSAHSCAIVSSGAQCWGSNDSGRTGVGNTTGSSYVPATVTTAGVVQQISAGNNHTCAVIGDGAWCWGGNGNGQLGSGTTAQSLVPLAVSDATSGVSGISAGNAYSCAVINGGVKCWGDNVSGRLGDGTSTQRLQPVTAIAAGSGALAVSVGAYHTCALVNGGVQCWGFNNYGNLGNSSTITSSVPVNAMAAGSGATAIAVGQSHTCAVVNGGVACWGINRSGQLGTGETTLGIPAPSQSSTPLFAIPIGSGVTGVSVGDSHSCAILGGATLCWGSNDSGQVGIDGSYALRKVNVIQQSTTIPVSLVPSAPTLTSMSGVAGGAALGFIAPITTGGSGITIYTATCSATGQPVATASVAVTAQNPTPTLVNIGELAGSVTYSCSLTATNSFGSSAASSPLTATTAALTVPAAPTITTTSPNVGGSITLNFSPPTANGGRAISNYNGTCSALGQVTRTATVTVPAPPAAAPVSVTLTGMVADAIYSCVLTATNSVGTSANSNFVTVTPVSSVPLVTITAPPPNSITNDNLTLTIDAAARIGTLASIDVLDGATVLGTFTITNNTIVTVNFVISAPSAGAHLYTARATDSTGQSITSAPVNITVRAKPSISLEALSGFHIAPAGIDLFAAAAATLTPGNATLPSINRVEISNGTTVIATLTAPPYNFHWANVAAGNYSLTARVTDSNGASSVSSPVAITVGTAAAMSINAATGIDGTITTNVDAYIGGTFVAPPNSAVSINGLIAVATSDGRFFINHLPLPTIGVNTVILTVTAPNGQAASQTISITRAPPPTPPPNAPIPPIFAVTVGQGGILAPGATLAVPINVAITNGIPFPTGAKIELSCQIGDTPTIYTIIAIGNIGCSYNTVGVFTITVVIKDINDAVLNTTIRQVKIADPRERLWIVRGVYLNLLDRMQANDAVGAGALFASHTKDAHQAYFTALGSRLTLVPAQLGTIASISIIGDVAEIIIIRDTAQGKRAFPVQINFGEDSVWRVEVM